MYGTCSANSDCPWPLVSECPSPEPFWGKAATQPKQTSPLSPYYMHFQPLGQRVTYGILGPETADPHAIGSPFATATL